MLEKKSLSEIFTIVTDLASTKGSLRGITLGKITPFVKNGNGQVDYALLYAEVQTDAGYRTYYYTFESDKGLVVEVSSKDGLHSFDSGIKGKYPVHA